MKISIILGVIHMLFGVCLSLFNHTYFKRKLNLWFQFIPQIVFLSFLFFYMVLLIFTKWVTYGPNPGHFGSNVSEYVQVSPYCAPSILITFINMVLMKNSPERKACSPVMYAGQSGIQTLLVICAFLCVPVMLFAKPYYIMKEQKMRTMNHQPMHSGENGDVGGSSVEQTVETHKASHEEDISELFIHQGIHTIEYVLGSVSHTASYLRLWALSLAHAQLAEVLWTMVLKNAVVQEGWFGGIIAWAGFAIWAVLTLGILVLMEGLSAFLHTLRLHWVEFQSKFYEGQGHSFQPFAFEAILDVASQSSEE